MLSESQHDERVNSELALISQLFSSRLRERDVRSLLAHLNGSTTHRFTGVYRFEPGWVVSLAFFDRKHPATELSCDVKMKESYCWLTGLGDTPFVIENATTDARLDGHTAQDVVRSYIAVLLRDRQSRPWGTVCHFDFAPREASSESIELLNQFRPLIEEYFVRESSSSWNPDAPSLARPSQTASL